jgi:Queuosine biosynthesis protein QueC
MRTNHAKADTQSRPVALHVAERGRPTGKGAVRCEIGENVKFSTESLESYFFAGWDATAFDALLVAAAVEFADRTQRRGAYLWQRDIELRIPVHDLSRWSAPSVSKTLHDALSLLTGDQWQITFCRRVRKARPADQGLLSLQADVEAVIPFSNGLDSRAVSGLTARQMGDRLVRIRLGSKLSESEQLPAERYPFTAVPYKVRSEDTVFVESSVRSRGFKFALISAVAACLAKAGQVIVPESGQGALGPALVTVGQGYEDYRSHPLFTRRMEAFVEALFGHQVRYVFPRLWSTKGETLREFIEECGDGKWSSTRSCWRQTRHVSVDGRRRQCGVCAACMLRRMSIHAAGLAEPREHYVWQNLSARSFNRGAAASYRNKGKITASAREYAIAGTLHLDHLAELAGANGHSRALDLAAFHVAVPLGMAQSDARARLERLLSQHRAEWNAFVQSLGPNSFVADWAPGSCS